MWKSLTNHNSKSNTWKEWNIGRSLPCSYRFELMCPGYSNPDISSKSKSIKMVWQSLLFTKVIYAVFVRLLAIVLQAFLYMYLCIPYRRSWSFVICSGDQAFTGLNQGLVSSKLNSIKIVYLTISYFQTLFLPLRLCLTFPLHWTLTNYANQLKGCTTWFTEKL